MNTTNGCQISYSYSEKNHYLSIRYSGCGSINHLRRVWPKSLALLKHYRPQMVMIDLDNLKTYDSAFVHLLTQLKSIQKKEHNQFLLKSADYSIMPLFKLYDEMEDVALEEKTHKISFFEAIGLFIFSFYHGLLQSISFLGEMLLKVGYVGKYFKFFVKELYAAGPSGLLITGLMGFILGVILAFQGVIVLAIFGAQIYVVNMVVIAMARELAPLMTAFVVTGRSVSAFAAEIGSMKVNQEIDALTTMEIDKTAFLIVPKVLAITLMIPLLNLYMLLFGFLGCALIFMSLGYSFDFFYAQLSQSLNVTDLMGGLFKVMVFGAIISSVGCVYGLKAKQGATSVGMAATKSVVLSIVLIAVADGLFAILFYKLGI